MADNLTPAPSADELLGPRKPAVEGLLGPAPDPVVPPSPSFFARFTDAIKKAGTAFGSGFKSGYGEGQLGFSPESEKTLRDLGLFLPGRAPSVGENLSGVTMLRALNEAIATPAADVVDFVVRATEGGFEGGADAIGSLVGSIAPGRQIGAVVDAKTGEVKRPIMEGEQRGKDVADAIKDIGSFLAQTGLAGPEATFTRLAVTKTGRVIDQKIGDGLPRESDFKQAAAVIEEAPVASEATEQALLKVYEEKGITPHEVAADIADDITVKQDLLTGEVPEAYGGAKPETPQTPLETAPRKDGELVPAEDAVPPVETGANELTLSGEGASPPPVKPPEPKAGAGGGEAGKPPSFDDAERAILDRISVGDHDPKRKWSFDSFYTAFVDDLNPVKVAVKEAQKKIGDGKLPVSDDPYSLFRLTRGTFGKADHWLVYSPFEFDTYANTGRSLKEILDPVKKDLDGLRAYVAAKRAVELEARGIQSGFDIEAARVVAGKGAAKYEAIQTGLVDYQNQLTKYLKDAGILSDKAYDAMLEANREYVPFFRYMDPEERARLMVSPRKLGATNPLKKIEGADLPIVDPIESVIKNTYAYVAMAEKNAAGVKLVDLLKEANAGTTYIRELIPYPDATTPKPAVRHLDGPKGAEQLTGPEPSKLAQAFDKAEFEVPAKSEGTIKGARDAIDVEFEEILKDAGIKDRDLRVVIQTAGTTPEGDVITVFRDGKRESYAVADPALVAAWRGLDQQSASLLTQVLAVPARTLRAGATLSPEFMARNVIRDFIGAVINSKGVLFSPLDTASGLKSAITKDVAFRDWLKGGGANSALVSLDRRYLQENIFKLSGTKNPAKLAWNVVTTPIRGLRLASELAENATRLGEFKKLAKPGSDKAAIQAAAMSSREVTLDFARIGAKMRAYNMITAFGNAQIQGTDRILRAFKEAPVATSLRVAGGVTAPSVLLWWANHDDPRWREIPAWQKDIFWIVLTDDTIYRIPKPFETGVIFGSGPERALDAYFADNPDAFEGFSKSMVEMLTPSIVPTIAAPIAEQWSNRSLFTGDQVIPSHLEDQLPEYQYTQYTTETAKSIGRIIGAFPGMREMATDPHSPGQGMAQALTTPILLENYLRNWTGGLGTYALQIADVGLRKSGVLPDPTKPTSTLADIPFVRAFVVRYPSASVASVQRFFDRNEQNQKIMATLKTQAQQGDIDAFERVQSVYGQRVVLDQAASAIGDLSKLVRYIYQNPEMSADDKRQLIDSAYFQMIEIARQSNKMLDEIGKAVEDQGDDK